MHTLYMVERLCDYLAMYEQKEVCNAESFLILKKICKPTEFKCLFETVHVELCM